MSRSAPLRVRFVVDPQDRCAPWPVSVLRDTLAADGHDVEIRSSMGSSSGIDVVHAFGAKAATEVSEATQGSVPWVLSFADSSVDDLTSDHRLRAVALAADAVLVRSSAQSLRVSVLGVPRSRCVVLPVGVDTATFLRRGPMANRTDRRRLVVELSAAGAPVALEALTHLPGTELVALGPRDRRDDLVDEVQRFLGRAQELGVRDRVVVGWYDEPREKAWWVRSAHVALALGAEPGRPEFVAEAMACGVAVVATPVEAQRDLVLHDITGLLVAEHDPAATVRAIRSILDDDFRLEALGLAGADRALGRLDWARVGVELTSAYRRVLVADDAAEDDLEALDRAG